MDGEEAPASSPFTPRSALVRTPPTGLAPPHSRLQHEEDMALTPPVPFRPPRPPPPPTSTSSSSRTKRPLTSPEERRPVEVIRLCRPVPPDPSAQTSGEQARGSRPMTPEAGPSKEDHQDQEQDEDSEADRQSSLARATKVELLDRVNNDLASIMSTVKGPVSRLNKDSVNTISLAVQDTLAVVAALSLRLCEMEAEVCEEKLRVAKLEQELLRAKAASQMGTHQCAHSSGGAAPVSYASALRVSKKAEPVPIPPNRGPVLVFYPAPEHAAEFKSAEDTKTELKKSIKPADIQVQVERLRKVGNAGVVVQTTSEASAEKLRQATPATLRVTEPKRRSPLVSLRHIDGDGDMEQIYLSLHEQNFKTQRGSRSGWSVTPATGRLRI